MSFTYKKKISLFHVLSQSVYAKTNREIYTNRGRMLGANAFAEQQLFSRQKELEVLMPQLLKVSPSASNWQNLLQKYFATIQKEIPQSGISLDISLRYDIADEKKQEAIKQVILKAAKKKVELKTSEDLANYCEQEKIGKDSYVRDDEDYLIATPTNIEDYVLYRFVTYHGEVANSKELVANAPKKIKFYLESDVDRKLNAKKLYETKRKINRYKSKVEEDVALRKALITIFNIQETDEIDQLMALDTIADNESDRFLEIVSDKRVIKRGNIEAMINSGVLSKYPNSGLIIDSEDRERTIGQSMDEAIAYFDNPANQAITSAIIARHKYLTTKQE